MQLTTMRATNVFARGVPLVAVSAADQNEAVELIDGAATVYGCPLVGYSVARGCYPVRNDFDLGSIGIEEGAAVTNWAAFLKLVESKAGQASFVWINSHRHIKEALATSYLFHLRNALKSDPSQSLWLLGPDVEIAAENSHDVLRCSLPLPGREELQSIAQQLATLAHENHVWEDEAEITTPIVESVVGLTEFQAEQSLALAIGDKGFDVDEAWAQKQALISATPGLTVAKVDGRGFDAIGGCDGVKDYLGSYLNGPHRPSAVIWFDEIEKAMSGAGGGDLSGVSADFLGTLLTWMEEHTVPGAIFVGMPGTAKSAMAKACGAEIDAPTVRLDLGACKGSLVGESQRQLRAALRVVDGVSGDRPFVVATCNSMSDLPPELLRRFGLGVIYFPIPTEDERRPIWEIQLGNHGFDAILKSGVDPLLDCSDGWTGAEIDVACRRANMCGVLPGDMAHLIRPISVTQSEKLAELETQARASWIDASTGRVFGSPGRSKQTKAPKKSRTIRKRPEMTVNKKAATAG